MKLKITDVAIDVIKDDIDAISQEISRTEHKLRMHRMRYHALTRELHERIMRQIRLWPEEKEDE